MTAPAADMTAPAADIPAIANVPAEHAVLGAILFDNRTLGLVGPFLQDRHFFEPLHQRMFALCREAHDAGRLIDPSLIAGKLAGDKAFAELGGWGYLGALLDRAPPPENAPEYARSIFDAAVRRDVIEVCRIGMKAAAEALDAPAFDVAAEVRRGIEAVEQDAAPDDTAMTSADVAAAEAIAAMQDRARNGKARGLMTGLRCVDYRLNGLRPGALYVIGGRPAMGKTSVARCILHGAADRNRNHRFIYFSLEMGRGEIAERTLSALTHFHREGVEYRAMSSGALTPMDLMAIDEVRHHVPANLIIEDSGSLSLDDVARKLWAEARKWPVGAIVIDYLQLMRRPRADGRNEASVLGEITRGLKQLARRTGTCIVLLSQLSRAVEQRDDKRPVLADLRESGAIEQDADAVQFVYREHYYLTKAEPTNKVGDKYLEWEMRCAETRQQMDVICAKQRQGPEGSDRQTYHKEFDAIGDAHD